MFKSRANKSADKASKSKPFKQEYFDNCHRAYSCIHCRAHLANHDELISKLFQGNHGRAYLFNKVTNVGTKQAVQRELLTGPHAVADIYCDSCETTLGWKYEQAYVPSQKYKEGKYIIELVHMLKENEWDLSSRNARQLIEEEEQREREESSYGFISSWPPSDEIFVGSSTLATNRPDPKKQEQVVSYYTSNLNETLAATTNTNGSTIVNSDNVISTSGNENNFDLESRNQENLSPITMHRQQKLDTGNTNNNGQLTANQQTVSKFASSLATGILKLEMITTDGGALARPVGVECKEKGTGGGGAPMVAAAPLVARERNATATV